MNIVQRIEALRGLMKEKGIDAYIIPSTDPHQSEYVAEHWKSRAWISGFTGSAGTVVITLNEGGLWTDGRYFIQAEKQLEGSGIKLFKMAQPGVPGFVEWLFNNLKKADCVGFDGRFFAAARVRDMEAKFTKKGIKLNKNYDLIDLIWKDRPNIPVNPIINHDVKYSGKTSYEKLEEIRKEMKTLGAEYYLLSSLDDVAWLFNIRGNDVLNNPVVTAHALVSMDKAWLFIDKRKVGQGEGLELNNNGIEVMDYEAILDFLKNINNRKSILFDGEKINSQLYDTIPEGCIKIEEPNVTTGLKAIKNKVEIENLKGCQLKDGVAMVKFLYWLDENLGKIDITEISASEKLEEFRSKLENFKGISFDTIAGYKDHAAMMHYKATKESQYSLKKEGMLLIDSGGQYLDGTTDITRTIVLGELTAEEKRDFTLTLKAHIGLSRGVFLHGSTGCNLDILARRPLWEQGIDYKCGTGHGVGFFLNVHEGPQGFRQNPTNVVLEKGMVITNEPGVYREGKHGVRIENTLLVIEDRETEFGSFMKFETISYCPISLRGIDESMLSKDEKEWINDYHKKVYEKLSPYLNEEENNWLKSETKTII